MSQLGQEQFDTNLQINQLVVSEKSVVKNLYIGGLLYPVTFIRDDADDEFPYYLPDNNGEFCTRVSEHRLFDVVDGTKFNDIKEFIESFGDNVTSCTWNDGGVYEKACDEYGKEYVNVFANHVVVMSEF